MDTLRLFVAVEIPESFRAPIAALQQELPDEGIKNVTLENLHFTLQFLGDVDSQKVASIEQALRTIRFRSFRLTLKGVGVFPNENYIRVIWIGGESEPLAALARQVQDALHSFPKENFSAHLTIARVKRKVEIKHFLEKHREEAFGQFDVSAFHLKQSQLSRGGPTYTKVATFAATE